LLEGKFTSLYANRLTSQLQDSLSQFSNKPFLPAANKAGKQIVVSDGDIVTNVVTKTEGALPMGMQQYENYQFANKEFLMNAVDYLVNPNGVLEARNKDLTLRLLDKQKVATQKTTWQIINIVVPLLLIILFGWVYQLRRKRMFTV
jgi:gliding-associated putative ABC transporter substrate-binding component GldG